MDIFSKKFILFNVCHVSICFFVTIVTILILGGKNFIEYSLFEKAVRGLFALFYFIGTAYLFVKFILGYFSKYVDSTVMGKTAIYISPVWLILSAYLYGILSP